MEINDYSEETFKGLKNIPEYDNINDYIRAEVKEMINNYNKKIKTVAENKLVYAIREIKF